MSVNARNGARLALVVAAISATGAVAIGTAGATTHVVAAAKAPVSVYVVQGVPRSTVQVAIDGKTVDQRLGAEGILGPLPMPAGKHTFTFRTTGWTVSSAVKVRAASSDVVLHWPAEVSAKPSVTVFANDMQAVGPDKGRLTVAHTAVVPPADVRVDEQVLFANIANGEFVSADVPSGNYSVDLVPTGQDGSPLLGPLTLPVQPGQLTRVFAIGEPRDHSMDAIVHRLPLDNAGSRAPDLVDAGSAGLAATPPAEAKGELTVSPGSLWAGVSLLGLAAGALALVRRRSLLGRG